jgi:TatD DNase family protein
VTPPEGPVGPAVDAHAHLTAAPTGPGQWVVPGVDAAHDAASRALADGRRVIAAAGLHPWYLPAADALNAALSALAERAVGACAIGETGLDKGRRAGPKDVQEAAFLGQIALAESLDLPLILHVVRRHGAALELLDGFPHGGMVHDFGGPAELVPAWVDAGFFLSISPRRRDLGFVRAIPPERLLVETDDFGPDALGPLVRRLAIELGTTPSALAAQTAANARRLFPQLA